MPAVAEMTQEELVKYDTERRAVRQAVQDRGVGTQMQISYDSRLPASMISNVLTGRYTDPKTLDIIQKWLEEHPAENRG